MIIHKNKHAAFSPRRQPDGVRCAVKGSSRRSRMLYLARLHVVMGAVRTFHVAYAGLQRVGRLPSMVWLLTPYAQWKREQNAKKWQRALNETWPEFYEKVERNHAKNPWLPPISENPPQVCQNLVKRSSW